MNIARAPEDFLKALDFSLKWEVGNVVNGGYTNDPDDPGGSAEISDGLATKTSVSNTQEKRKQIEWLRAK